MWRVSKAGLSLHTVIQLYPGVRAVGRRVLLEPLIVGGGEGHVVPGGIHQALEGVLIEDILLVLKCCHVKYMEIFYLVH